MKSRSLLHAAASERQWRRRYYCAYTLAFGLTALVVFACYIHSNYSLICDTDSWPQHYKALCWYGHYLRQILRTLLHEHRLVLPNFDITIGEGSDVLTTLHYYVIGDPIALFSVLVPQRWMHYFYSFGCVLRMYLAGLAFSALALGTGKRNRHAILAGAISYAFCMWSLSSAVRHPYFLDPAIYFPLLVLGIEKILTDRRPYVFILTAAFSALSNFYFFVMVAILGVLYALIRLLMWRERDWKQKLLLLLRMGLYALLGVGVAAIILLPVLLGFLGDSRTTVDIPFRLFFPLSFYAELPAIALGSSHAYWTMGGLSAPLLLALAALVLRRKQSPLLRVLLLVCGLFLTFPIFGRLFNGLSYSVNRWSWLIPLLGAYVLTDQWDALHDLSRRELGRLLLFALLLFGWMVFSPQARATLSIAAGFLLMLSLFVLGTHFSAGRLSTQKITVLLAAASVCLVGVWYLAPDFANYMQSCYSNERVLDERDHSEAHAIRALADEAVPRYAAADVTRNAGIMAGISSTQFYWSNSNPWLNRYKDELELNESTYSMTDNYDLRTVPITLAAVQYFSYPGTDGTAVPYGFVTQQTVQLNEQRLEREEEKLLEVLGTEELSEAQSDRLEERLGDGTTTITRSQWAMPLGYCYDRQISRETWEGLSALQRQQIQLEAVCVEDPKGDEAGSKLPFWEGSLGDYSLPYEIEYLSDSVNPMEGGLVCTEGGARIRLHFTGLPKAENYLRLAGMAYEPVTDAALYTQDQSVDPLDLLNPTDVDLLLPRNRLNVLRQVLYGTDGFGLNFPVAPSSGPRTSLFYRTPDNNYSAGRSSFLVNLGYREEPLEDVTIALPRAGLYYFREMEVLAAPMEDFGEKIEALRADSLEEYGVENDRAWGKIHLDQPKLLVVAIPYSTGWTALVDGEPAPVLLANGRYLGLDLAAGDHAIELRYATPYLRQGALISGVSLLVFGGLVLCTERRRRRERESH